MVASKDVKSKMSRARILQIAQKVIYRQQVILWPWTITSCWLPTALRRAYNVLYTARLAVRPIVVKENFLTHTVNNKRKEGRPDLVEWISRNFFTVDLSNNYKRRRL
jgi:hypothetical protein